MGVPLFIIERHVDCRTATYYCYCTHKDCTFFAKANVISKEAMKYISEHDEGRMVEYVLIEGRTIKYVRVEALDCTLSVQHKLIKKLLTKLGCKIRNRVAKKTITPTIDRVNEFLDNIQGQCEDRLMERLSSEANEILGILDFIRERINPK